MLRFKPDNWLEGLLRPLILADPVGFVYFELPAPDLRFALLLLLLLPAIASRRMRLRIGIEGWRALVALAVMFYVWTFVIGNGRYFMAGLLLAGPLVVLLIARLPATRSMRTLVLVGAVGLQGVVVHQHYTPGQWAKAFWTDGTGLLVTEPPRLPPAVFITITNISYSILVPQFHPDSRWVNLVGQRSIGPAMLEYGQWERARQSGLPMYVIFPAAPGTAVDARQPEAAFQRMVATSLAPFGLSSRIEACQVMSTHATMKALSGMEASNAPRLSFWLCPVARGSASDFDPSQPSRWADVFEQVERHCPRFFPPGGAEERAADGYVFRDYIGADTKLYVEEQGWVFYRHLRALSPTLLGHAEQVRRREFTIDCRKLPGRYVYPWQRD